MREINTSLYYTLVWSHTLDKRKDLILKGVKIDKSTKLPNDPKILYGAHKNDVAKIKKVTKVNEIKYDYRTGKETIQCWDKVEEYTLPRDVCIVVWPHGDTLYPEFEEYRIVTPQVFEDIVSRQTSSSASKDVIADLFVYKDPKKEIRFDIASKLYQY